MRRRDAEPAGRAFRPVHTSPEPPPTRGQAEAGARGRARLRGRRGRVSLQQVRPAGRPPSFRAPSGAALATFPAGLPGTTATLGRKPEWIFQRRRRRRDAPRINDPSLSSKRRMCEVATSDRQKDQEVNFKELRTTTKMAPELLSGHIPPGHIPKPIVMPDYVAKYPVIQTDDDRERYKAVFQDQFSEYKELSAEVQATLRKFDELDTVMSRLPHHSENRQEHERISRIHEEFRKKKNDPSFLEKKERCEYLKNKLSHIKQRIQEYDKVMNWDTQGYP
uniref:MARVEL domain containing 2 n=1 Tax=Rattus norvegicus TaxID=10116 RepID=A0ABK0LEZ2_RAT